MFTTAGMTLLITRTIGSSATLIWPGGGVTLPAGAVREGLGPWPAAGALEVWAATRPGSRLSRPPARRQTFMVGKLDFTYA